MPAAAATIRSGQVEITSTITIYTFLFNLAIHWLGTHSKLFLATSPGTIRWKPFRAKSLHWKFAYSHVLGWPTFSVETLSRWGALAEQNARVSRQKFRCKRKCSRTISLYSSNGSQNLSIKLVQMSRPWKRWPSRQWHSLMCEMFRDSS